MIIPEVDVVLNFAAGTVPETQHRNILSGLRISSLQDYWLRVEKKPHIFFGVGKHNYLTDVTRDRPGSNIYMDFFVDQRIGIKPDPETLHKTDEGFDTLTEALGFYKLIKQHPEWKRIMFNTSGAHEKRTEEILKKVFGLGYIFFRNPFAFPDRKYMNTEREKLHLLLFRDYWGAWPDGQIPYVGDKSFFEAHPWFYGETLKIIETTRNQNKESMADAAYMKK